MQFADRYQCSGETLLYRATGQIVQAHQTIQCHMPGKHSPRVLKS